MEIEQYLYEFTEAGEAIIAYKMISPTGCVELCNLGASIISFKIADIEIAAGQAVRSFATPSAPRSNDKSLSERIWDSWVEGNRVIMATVEQIAESSLTIELVFDYDDENTLEITYQACCDAELLLDLTHLLTLDMGGETMIKKIDSEECGSIRHITSAQRNILGEIATIDGREITLELLSTHPALYTEQGQIATIAHPNIHIKEGERFIQKTVLRANLKR